jgi:DNA-binding cell septation regulator SpoVG
MLRILRWAPYRNPSGTQIGFLDAELPSGMIVHGLRLMVGPKGGRWLAMPSEKRLDPNGKAIWSDIVAFRDRETRDRFQDAVLALLRAAHPELFVGEPGP